MPSDELRRFIEERNGLPMHRGEVRRLNFLVKRIEKAAYRQGAEDMRERAAVAKVHWTTTGEHPACVADRYRMSDKRLWDLWRAGCDCTPVSDVTEFHSRLCVEEGLRSIAAEAAEDMQKRAVLAVWQTYERHPGSIGSNALSGLIADAIRALDLERFPPEVPDDT